MPTKKKLRKPMSEEARAAAAERMRKLNDAKRIEAATPTVPPDIARAMSQPQPEPTHECQWVAGDYKAHDGNGWRLAQVYCPVGKHWESVDA